AAGLSCPLIRPAKQNAPPSPSWTQPLGMATAALRPSWYSTRNSAASFDLAVKVGKSPGACAGTRASAASSRVFEKRPWWSACHDRARLQTLDGLDAGLASFASLDEALHGFQRVKSVRLQGPIPYLTRFGHLAAFRQFQRRPPQSHRQRRARHERKEEFAR